MTHPTNATEYDAVIVGATPGGIACAVRAARENLRVLLVERGHHLGGMLTNGLGVEDTLYLGDRAPLYTEFREGVKRHYRDTYGPDSEQYKTCISSRLTFEPRVAESVLTGIVEAEPTIEVRRGVTPLSVERAGRRINALDLDDGSTVRAGAFVDATYEADLAALAGVAYRVGRESRTEFGEQHAGRLFTTHVAAPGGFPREAAAGKLNLITFRLTGGEMCAGSTGEGDRAIQAFNYRVCLSRDPDNRLLPERPATYDRNDYLGIVLDQGDTVGTPYPIKAQLLLDDVQKLRMGQGNLPNHKQSWNQPTIPGAGHDWPDGDWETRDKIAQRHWDHTLGMLWFLQNDPDVPEAVREDAKRWGLARDEFADNCHRPYELYVREARRIVGRYTCSEHDGTLQRGSRRAPIHHDSIAITEWPMDSHECTTERQFGTLYDGKFLMAEATRPGHIPYRCLLPVDLDNLLVPVCMSSTHVGWGTLRLEPVWMHVGESAGHALALSDQVGVDPAAVPIDALQRRLVERGVMVTFFNEFDMATDAPWVPAVQYWGTKGLFPSYDARPHDPLDAATATQWSRLSGLSVISGATRAAACQSMYVARASTQPVS